MFTQYIDAGFHAQDNKSTDKSKRKEPFLKKKIKIKENIIEQNITEQNNHSSL